MTPRRNSMKVSVGNIDRRVFVRIGDDISFQLSPWDAQRFAAAILEEIPKCVPGMPTMQDVMNEDQPHQPQETP